MQTYPVSLSAKQKPSPSSNPLKQLFSHNLSPKHKPSQGNRQKPFSSPSLIQLGNKYVYSYEDLIGDGFTSKVYKGYDIEKRTKPYAIKVIDKSRLSTDQMKLIRNQVDLHPRLDHKFVVKCYDVYDTPKFIYIILELCQNGDLAQYLLSFRDKNMPEYRAIILMEQVIDGCKYLVQQGILHRDLKPQNILRAGNTLKIADFGFAVKGKKTLIDSMNVGTPLYMPPQAIEECVYSHKSDFFALGVIMYEILHGKTPWYKNDEKALAKFMKNVQIDLSKIKNVNIKYFIQKTCQISQGHRMSVDEFIQFDFRQAQLKIQLSLEVSQTLKTTKPNSQKTDRIVKQQNQISSQEVGAKSTRSKKSQTAMQATFVSNHIYFKTAKCEETKKITADFEEKFELCLLLKYLIQNSQEFILIDEFDKKNLRIVLFRHCIFILKKLINEFTRTKSLDLKNWLEYKEGQEFKLFEEQCKMIKEKMEKQFNLQLKGMSLKNLSEVNKRFPELATQYELSKNFYQKLKEYLRQVIRKFHQEILKKMVKKSANFLSPLISNNNSGHFEAFKSLYRYHESCAQKLCQQDINKSMVYCTSTKQISTVRTSNTKTTTTQNSSNVSSNLQALNASTKIEFFFSRPFNNEEFSFGKKLAVNTHHFNHLSPEHEKISLNSPRSKQLLNKTTGKNFFNQVVGQDESKKEMKGLQLVQEQNTSKPHHYYSYGLNYAQSEAEKNVDSTVVSVYSPGKKFLSPKVQRVQKVQKLDYVQSYFGEVLCRSYIQSKSTREEFMAIKKKIKWLW